MLFRRGEKKRLDRYSWVACEPSQERTRALVLIESALCYLRKRRSPLIMEQGQDKSSPTILLGYTRDHLLIDSPADWQLRMAPARFHYKDHANIDCYFDSLIDFIKEGVIHASHPECLIRVQRRAHHRVNVPCGSEAVFFHPGGRQARLAVKNVSAGGMLCCSRSDRIDVGSTVRNIDLLLASQAAGDRVWYAEMVNIPQGRVVRTYIDEDTGLVYYGIAFECGAREEGNLLKYVRQREIELAVKAACH